MNRKYLSIMMVSIILFACKGFTGEKEPDINPNACNQYACPVHTDKTSTTLENCSVCKKQMIPLCDSLKRDSVKH